MKIGEIIAKAAKGETLTDEEKTALSEFDVQKQIDSAAAAARKEAETKAEQAKSEAAKMQKQIDDLNAAIKAKEDAGKTDLEKANEQVATFAKQLKALESKVQAAEAEKASLVRNQKLDAVLNKAGIQFIEGVDHGILKKAFSGMFDGIDDLENDEVVKPILNTFKATNKGVIVDTSGHGSGNPANQGGGRPPESDPSTMSAADREKDLKTKGII